MALSTSNRRRFISNSNSTNATNGSSNATSSVSNASTPTNVYTSTKLTRRLVNNVNNNNNNNNTPSDSSSSTSGNNRGKLNKTPANTAATTSSAINKEKRLIHTNNSAGKVNGYLSGTMSTTAKSKKHSNQINSAKKAKLLGKSSHSHNNTPINSKLKSLNKENGHKSSVSKKLLLSTTKSIKNNQKHGLGEDSKAAHMRHSSSTQAKGSRSGGGGVFDFGEDTQSINAQSLFDFSSKEEFKMSEQFYEQRLKKLLEQLAELNGLKHESPLLIGETKVLEKESNENLLVTRALFEKNKQDIEQQYLTEYNKAIQEFHDKRREIKENLRNEHDEMRKQIDIDRNCLDINTDIADTKPPPSRNLRRRNNVLNNTAYDHNVDTDVDSSVLIQSSVISGLAAGGVNILGANLSVSNSATSMILGQFSNSATNNLTSHANTINGFYSSLNNVGLNNSLGQVVNDRKRKLIPSTITFAINDDDVNEDFKFLVKNLNNHTLVKQQPPIDAT